MGGKEGEREEEGWMIWETVTPPEREVAIKSERENDMHFLFHALGNLLICNATT